MALRIFVHIGLERVQPLNVFADNPQTNDFFGFSVALSRDARRLIVGAPFEDGAAEGHPESGAAYVY